MQDRNLAVVVPHDLVAGVEQSLHDVVEVAPLLDWPGSGRLQDSERCSVLPDLDAHGQLTGERLGYLSPQQPPGLLGPRRVSGFVEA